jgi:hypothetical protein
VGISKDRVKDNTEEMMGIITGLEPFNNPNGTFNLGGPKQLAVAELDQKLASQQLFELLVVRSDVIFTYEKDKSALNEYNGKKTALLLYDITEERIKISRQLICGRLFGLKNSYHYEHEEEGNYRRDMKK